MSSRAKSTLISVVVALVVTLTVCSGLFENIDNDVSDMIYQSPSSTDGEIIIIGIDEKATDELGPMPWSRSIIAQVVENLNQNPDERPAAIGIDVLFIGESNDNEADERLVSACTVAGNVVISSAAIFGTEIVDLGNEFYIDETAVVSWDTPYDSLVETTPSGHVNAMIDGDGVLRHSILDIAGVKSFSRKLYEKYCHYNNLETNEPPMVDNDSFFYIPFLGVPGTYYEGVSVVDILKGDFDPEYYAGKIVLIGPYAAGMQDEYITSIDKSIKMYGVEIQANLIDAYRIGFFPDEASDRWQILIVFVVAMTAIILFRRIKLWFSLFIWGVSCIAYVGVCKSLYLYGYILHGFWIPAAVTIMLSISILLNYVKEITERKRIAGIFSKYIDPVVMAQLLERGNALETLGGELREIVVLFVDIRGFTPMSEKLPPNKVVEILNAYLSFTTECVMKNHGTLDKFVGDCTMAFWNAPVEQEDAIYLACRAAVDMIDKSKELTLEIKEKFGYEVFFGIGVHSGTAVVGNIGAEKRMDFTAIGDTVNIAARLEANAPGGQIFISKIVAEGLGEKAKCTSLGNTTQLKGKSADFEVFRLDALD